MEPDPETEIAESAKKDSSKGWTEFYLIVVGALVAQIAFFVWLTKTFD
jgi:hypothetical protein